MTLPKNHTLPQKSQIKGVNDFDPFRGLLTLMWRHIDSYNFLCVGALEHIDLSKENTNIIFKKSTFQNKIPCLKIGKPGQNYINMIG